MNIQPIFDDRDHVAHMIRSRVDRFLAVSNPKASPSGRIRLASCGHLVAAGYAVIVAD